MCGETLNNLTSIVMVLKVNAENKENQEVINKLYKKNIGLYSYMLLLLFYCVNIGLYSNVFQLAQQMKHCDTHNSTKLTTRATSPGHSDREGATASPPQPRLQNDSQALRIKRQAEAMAL